ncbi:MAG: MarR family winged helix-turn-helix transcriptional regulator [Dehalococcoidia bacterium]
MDQSQPDLGILLALAYRCFVDELTEGLSQAGFPGTRPAYGYLFRALQGDGLTVSGLAAQLQISKQATVKIVDDMEARGFVTRISNRADRREKTVRLTQRARDLMSVALQIGERVESEMVDQAGAQAVATMRAILTRYVEQHGGLEDALRRRARPVW